MTITIFLLLSTQILSQSKLCQNVYVWNFIDADNKTSEITKMLTDEVEDILSQAKDCSLLQRRYYADLQKQIENEFRILNIEGISSNLRQELKTIQAERVLFGEVKELNINVNLRLRLEHLSTKQIKTTSIFIEAKEIADSEMRTQILKKVIYELFEISVSKNGMESRSFGSEGEIFVHGAPFEMGSRGSGRVGDSDEYPHYVIIGNYYIGSKEVTVSEFKAFIDDTGYITDAERFGSLVYVQGKFMKKSSVNWRFDETGKLRHPRDYDYPVIHVSWNDAIAYCNWLSSKHHLDLVYEFPSPNSYPILKKSANGYRLPTEAEWEYAANGEGQNSIWAGTSQETILTKFANGRTTDDGFSMTSPVGSFKPNNLNLYDMSGNVWEWVYNYYSDDYSGGNHFGPASGHLRTRKGGSWYDEALLLRVSNRANNMPSECDAITGFRIARTSH